MTQTKRTGLAGKAKRGVAAFIAFILAGSLTAGLMPAPMAASAEEQPAAAAETDDTLDIAVLSDIHVLPSDLIKDTPDYRNALNSDRKIFTESQGILDRMLEEVKEESPDVLMISGDLTKDGELESHRYVAAQLEELKQELPELKIYVTNGNHDVNNSLAYNYNTEDGVSVPATRTTPELFIETYTDAVYNEDNGIVARFTPSSYSEAADGDKAGMLSYVAEPAEGYTIIVVDSGRYSADNTDEGTAEHQTSGQISDELKDWVVEQTQSAKAKGNTVIGMMHHGLIEHFDMEEEFLGDYLVNDYREISAAFADAGMHYVFTGHMHANDIATMTTEAGNELYDIETGSAVTYPCPMRFVSFSKYFEGNEVTVHADIETRTNLGGITYLTADKQEATIDDLTAYAKQPQFGLSENVIVNLGTGVVDGLLDIAEQQGVSALLESLISSLTGMDIPLDRAIDLLITLYIPEKADAAADASVYLDGNGDIFINSSVGGITISTEGLKESIAYLTDELDRIIAERTMLDGAVEQAITDIISLPVYEDESQTVTLIQLVNDVYQSHLSGDDNGRRPAYIDKVVAALENGELFVSLVNGIVDCLWDAVITVSGDISLAGFTGIGKITVTQTEDGSQVCTPAAADDRTAPLVLVNEDGTSPVLNLLVLFLGSYTDENEDGSLSFTEDAKVSNLLSLVNIVVDIPEMLKELLLGTPATDDAPAEEGIITGELQQTATDFLTGIIDSMSSDTNFADDGDTFITITQEVTPEAKEIAVTDFDIDYTVGDGFDGGKLIVIYSDGSTQSVELTADMLSGFDTSTAGEKTVTVSYGGLTATVTIEVSAAAQVPGDDTAEQPESGSGCNSAIGAGLIPAAVAMAAIAAAILLKRRANRQ